jgi:hypothetical protein
MLTLDKIIANISSFIKIEQTKPTQVQTTQQDHTNLVKPAGYKNINSSSIKI